MELVELVRLPTNPVMLALWAVSVFALAAILERTVAWMRIRARMRNSGELLDLTRHGAASAEINGKAVAAGRWGPFGHIFAEWQGSEGHRGHVEQAIATEQSTLERNVWILDCAAAIGPLLGILGTLVGISQSFQGFDAVAELDPTVVSHGISLALTTTVVGLVVAIVTVVFAHAFRRMTDQAVAEMENFGEQLLGLKER